MLKSGMRHHPIRPLPISMQVSGADPQRREPRKLRGGRGTTTYWAQGNSSVAPRVGKARGYAKDFFLPCTESTCVIENATFAFAVFTFVKLPSLRSLSQLCYSLATCSYRRRVIVEGLRESDLTVSSLELPGCSMPSRKNEDCCEAS